MLLHGWEGHAQSNYVVAAAAGQVFARPWTGLRAVVGFSLGGNFALRVANPAPAHGIEIDYALAVYPVIDPAAGLRQLERTPFYYAYFMRKWRASLRRKQLLFPARDLISREALRLNMRELTRALVMRHPDFDSIEAYLDGYSVAGDRLAGLRVPTTIPAAADDPVIPVADFRELRLPARVELDIAHQGGHCAFLSGTHPRGFVPGYLLARLHTRACADDFPRHSDPHGMRYVADGTGVL